jgi:hypothetical protein
MSIEDNEENYPPLWQFFSLDDQPQEDPFNPRNESPKFEEKNNLASLFVAGEHNPFDFSKEEEMVLNGDGHRQLLCSQQEIHERIKEHE